MNEEELSLKFKALADPKRVKILSALKILKGKTEATSTKVTGLSIRDLENYLKMSQPNVSHHLMHLKRAKLVKLKTEGPWRIVTINNEELGKVQEYLSRILEEV